jgi:hypothetical protein
MATAKRPAITYHSKVLLSEDESDWPNCRMQCYTKVTGPLLQGTAGEQVQVMGCLMPL